MSIPTNCTPYHLSLSHILTITKSQRLLLSLSLSEETEPNRVFRHCREQPLSLMEQDWDLHAVVRGCSSLLTSSTTTTTTTTSSSSSSSSGFGNNCYLYPESASSSSSSSCAGAGFSSVFDCEQALSLNPIEELHELCKPFFTTKSQPQFQASSPLSSSFSYSSSLPKQPQTQEKQQRSKNLLLSGGSVLTTPRSKRRKNQLKRVCEVPVENLSSDIWAWRKYGQKPIKGSPYPRGYYRCSSSKGCLARKQVERNRSDPTMFIVTYTAEHNHPAPTHRNSLAGSTRQKPLAPQSATTAGGGGESETGEKALAKPALSPITPVAEEEAQPQEEKLESREGKEEDVMDDDEEEGEFGVCDMVIPDDFFESLDELGQFTGFDDAITAGDFFNDPFSALPIPSWLAAATAASGS